MEDKTTNIDSFLSFSNNGNNSAKVNFYLTVLKDWMKDDCKGNEILKSVKQEMTREELYTVFSEMVPHERLNDDIRIGKVIGLVLTLIEFDMPYFSSYRDYYFECVGSTLPF